MKIVEWCEVCGGVSKCPRDWYLEVRRMPMEAIQHLPPDGPVPEGWKVTHWKKDYRIACKLEPLPGFELELVGTTQAGRILAHYGVHGMWVGATTYAFAVKRR